MCDLPRTIAMLILKVMTFVIGDDDFPDFLAKSRRPECQFDASNDSYLVYHQASRTTDVMIAALAARS